MNSRVISIFFILLITIIMVSCADPDQRVSFASELVEPMVTESKLEYSALGYKKTIGGLCDRRTKIIQVVDVASGEVMDPDSIFESQDLDCTQDGRWFFVYSEERLRILGLANGARVDFYWTLQNKAKHFTLYR